MKRHFAAYNDIGEIQGLYNLDQHKHNEIPPNSISIDQAQYAALTRRPMDFSVNVSLKLLMDSKASLAAVEADGLAEEVKVSGHLAGFMYNGVCYYADDLASQHITQCLLLTTFDEKFQAELKAVENGVTSYKTVTKKDLIAIAKGVNRLRVGL